MHVVLCRSSGHICHVSWQHYHYLLILIHFKLVLYKGAFIIKRFLWKIGLKYTSFKFIPVLFRTNDPFLGNISSYNNNININTNNWTAIAENYQSNLIKNEVIASFYFSCQKNIPIKKNFYRK